MLVVSILKTNPGRGWYSFVTSQNSDYVSEWKPEESGFDFWRGTGVFLLVTAWWHVLGTNQLPSPRVRGVAGKGVSWRVEWPGHAAYYLPQSNAENYEQMDLW